MATPSFLPKSHFRRPICPKGHKKWETGVYLGSHKCVACCAIGNSGRYGRLDFPPKENFRKPYCPRGHKKWVVGVIYGRCSICTRTAHRERWRKESEKRAYAPPQQIYDQCEEVRKLAGLRVATFLREIGIPRSTYTDWRQGRVASSRNIMAVVPELKRLLDERNERIRREHARRSDIQRHDRAHEGYATDAA